MTHEHGKGLTLPEDSAKRKDIPVCTGFLDYFPAAIAYAAMISKFGNDKHNPGEPLHHARGKSMDHADCILRHQMDRGGKDDQGIRHSGYVLWRAAAQLQEELEAAGEAPLPRGARLPEATIEIEVPASPCERTFDGECFEVKYADQRHPAAHRCDVCPAAGKTAEPGRPEYTVKPVPRHQYDPESTVGGW